MNKIKILYIVPSLRVCNGVANYAMNYYRNIDKEKFQIDFIIGADERSEYFEEIEKNGSRIFYIPKISMKNMFSVIKKIKNFFENNKFDIVHCHVLNMGAFYMYYAKKYHVSTRILHSHVTKTADSLIHKLRNDILLPIAVKNSNYFCACSQNAGKMIFRKNHFSIIYNAIDLERFKYNEKERSLLRKEYNIKEDTFVIGNIGRLCNQKNHKKLIDIFYHFIKRNVNTKLIIIGNGPLEKRLKEKCKRLNLENDVIFLKSTVDIQRYYNMFDLFVLPSIYEGLGIVLIEAQISNLMCVVSNVVPQEAKISDKYIEMSLKCDSEEWSLLIEKIYKEQIDNSDRKKEKCQTDLFDIKKSVKYVEEMYINYFTKEK